jgi:hypothetical protein
MRKNLIAIAFFICCSPYINGQNVDQDYTPWSFSLSYSPKFEIYIDSLEPEKKILSSFNFATDYRLNNKLSLTTGFNYNQKTKYQVAFSTGLYPGEIFFVIKHSQYEIPIQINYHFLGSQKKIDPFIKTSIKYVFYNYSLDELSLNYDYSESHSNRFIILELGLGSYIKINSDLMIFCSYSISSTTFRIFSKHNIGICKASP